MWRYIERGPGGCRTETFGMNVLERKQMQRMQLRLVFDHTDDGPHSKTGTENDVVNKKEDVICLVDDDKHQLQRPCDNSELDNVGEICHMFLPGSRETTRRANGEPDKGTSTRRRQTSSFETVGTWNENGDDVSGSLIEDNHRGKQQSTYQQMVTQINSTP